MNDSPAALDYATHLAPRRKWWWFHIWLLPILWVPGSIGSTKRIGDEYGAWAFANLIGAPIASIMFVPMIRAVSRRAR